MGGLYVGLWNELSVDCFGDESCLGLDGCLSLVCLAKAEGHLRHLRHLRHWYWCFSPRGESTVSV